jgi:hypothetical protein
MEIKRHNRALHLLLFTRKRMRIWYRFIKLLRYWRQFNFRASGVDLLNFRARGVDLLNVRFCASGVDLQEIFAICLRKRTFK